MRFMGTQFIFKKCDALRDLVPFVQFKKSEKHQRRSVKFSKIKTLLKLKLLHGCFSLFKNCTKVPNRATHHK